MKYPVVTKESPDGISWLVLDADGCHVGHANTEATANTIRDAMNKCAPPPDPKTLPLAEVQPMEAWAWATKSGAPLVACLGEGFAHRSAAQDEVRPVKGRFIPDNLPREQIYAEVARLLAMTEDSVSSPSVDDTADFNTMPVAYEADRDGVRLMWDGPTVDMVVTTLREVAIEHRDGRGHDWDALEREHRAGEDADARCSDAD